MSDVTESKVRIDYAKLYNDIRAKGKELGIQRHGELASRAGISNGTLSALRKFMISDGVRKEYPDYDPPALKYKMPLADYATCCIRLGFSLFDYLIIE